MRPLGSRVVVKPDDLEEKSEGGILLQYDNKKAHEAKTNTGEIIALGALAFVGYAEGETWPKVGDRVEFISHGGVFREHDGVKTRVLNDEDIILVEDC